MKCNNEQRGHKAQGRMMIRPYYQIFLGIVILGFLGCADDLLPMPVSPEEWANPTAVSSSSPAGGGASSSSMMLYSSSGASSPSSSSYEVYVPPPPPEEDLVEIACSYYNTCFMVKREVCLNLPGAKEVAACPGASSSALVQF
jgi:hypothetical protein